MLVGRTPNLNHPLGSEDAERPLSFVSISSIFYPALNSYYVDRASSVPRRGGRDVVKITPSSLTAVVCRDDLLLGQLEER